MKKILALVACLSLVASLAIGGSIAYLTDRDSAVNVFTMGDVDIEINEDFEQDSPLLPGQTVDKEVTIKNTGDNEAYVWFTYTVPSALVNYLTIDPQTSNDWTNAELVGEFYGEDGVTKYTTFRRLYNSKLAAGSETTDGMTDVTLDPTVDVINDEYVAVVHGVATPLGFSVKNPVKILVNAYAMQTEGFPTIGDAYAAYTTQWALENETVVNPFTGVAQPWDGAESEAPAADPEDANVYLINTAADLAGLAEMVNAGNTMNKKTVKLTADIDLGNKEWTPIGKETAKFQGTFDGQGHTISNLKVTGNNSYVGLFGYTTDGEIKNLNLHNAQVSGYLGVGTVSGCPYGSKFTNINVTGTVKVDGFAYVGGVVGRNAYADITDITVDVTEDSYVKANSIEGDKAYRTYVGGVIGFMGEGGHKVTNVKSNIDVYGSTIDVGGITGIAHYGNSFINCSSSGDVTITDAEEAGDAEEIGGIAGVWHNQNGQTVTFDGCSYTGKLTANITDGVDLTNNTIHGAAYSATGTGTVIVK